MTDKIDQLMRRITATQEDYETIKLLGSGRVIRGVTLTKKQDKALRTYLGADLDLDKNVLSEAGAKRNESRLMTRLGLRVMALLLLYLEPAEDPVEFVLNLMRDAGYDVPY